MNDAFRDVKARLRKLDELLGRGGPSHMEFAQAVSRARRVLKRGDRTREPGSELRALLERAEELASTVR